MDQSPCARALAEEVEKCRSEKGKIYRIDLAEIHALPERYCAVTASKDLFLELGRMSYAVRCLLAQLLNELCDKEPNGQLLFQLREDGAVTFVTKTTHQRTITFTLAPAH